MAAAAVFQMGCLEDMGVYVECMPKESVEGNLYRAILLVAGDDFVQVRRN